jgi:hypothetical protein
MGKGRSIRHLYRKSVVGNLEKGSLWDGQIKKE